MVAVGIHTAAVVAALLVQTELPVPLVAVAGTAADQMDQLGMEVLLEVDMSSVDMSAGPLPRMDFGDIQPEGYSRARGS